MDTEHKSTLKSTENKLQTYIKKKGELGRYSNLHSLSHNMAIVLTFWSEFNYKIDSFFAIPQAKQASTTIFIYFGL